MKGKMQFRKDGPVPVKTFSERGWKRKKIAVISIMVLLFSVIVLCIILIEYSQDVEQLTSNVEEKGSRLNQTQDNLMGAYRRIRNLTNEKTNLSIDLWLTSKHLNETLGYLNETVCDLRQANESIVELQTEISYARQGDSYRIHDPTYAEMRLFIDENTVNENSYDVDFYLCRHFARDLRNAATERGIRCAYVEFYGSKPADDITGNQSRWTGHCVVCFDTPDHGRVFIEPRYDTEASIALHEVYWDIYIQDLLIVW